PLSSKEYNYLIASFLVTFAVIFITHFQHFIIVVTTSAMFQFFIILIIRNIKFHLVSIISERFRCIKFFRRYFFSFWCNFFVTNHFLILNWIFVFITWLCVSFSYATVFYALTCRISNNPYTNQQCNDCTYQPTYLFNLCR